MTPKIEIRGLYKAFGSKVVLDGIDLDVEKGTSMVVIGGSGTGKSVLIKCVLGILTPDLKVWENITFALLQNKQISKAAARDLAVEKLKSVGLGADVANLSPAELSGGMQKRVALARAIAAKPEIIFFDEPTTGLDPIMSDVINDLIVKCSKEVGATTLSITHDMASVRKIASRVAMLYQGKLIWQDDVTKIDTSNNAYVDQFVHGRAVGPITAGIR